MAARIYIRVRRTATNAAEGQPYRLLGSEQAEVARELMAKPAEEIRKLLSGPLDAVNALDTRDDVRRQFLQALIDQGDALKDKPDETQRQERRSLYARAFVMALSIIEDTPPPATGGILFYDGPAPTLRLAALCERLISSALRSFLILPNASWNELERVLPSADRLWALGLVLAGWFLATIVGGWIAVAVNALLFALGAADLWDRAKRSWESLKNWFLGAYDAKNTAALDRAAKDFADGLAVGGIAVIELVVAHFAFKAIEARLLARFPAPEWLRRDFSEAVKRERGRRPPKENERARGREEESPKKKGDRPRPREDETPTRPRDAEPARSVPAPGVRVLGAPPAADKVATGLSPLGWLAVVALGYFGLQALQRKGDEK